MPGPERQLVDALDRRGLRAPAQLLVDAHRPLGPLLDDLGAALGPLGRAAGLPAAVAAWLAEPDALGRLAAALDDEGVVDAEPG